MLPCLGSHQRIALPNGVKANAISLKCCLPKGIPIMVMQNSKPKKRCVSATHTPPQTIQRIFKSVYRHPVLADVWVMAVPKGVREAMASLNSWTPKGIPIIVRQSTSPPMRYSKKMVTIKPVFTDLLTIV